MCIYIYIYVLGRRGRDRRRRGRAVEARAPRRHERLRAERSLLALAGRSSSRNPFILVRVGLARSAPEERTQNSFANEDKVGDSFWCVFQRTVPTRLVSRRTPPWEASASARGRRWSARATCRAPPSGSAAPSRVYYHYYCYY